MRVAREPIPYDDFRTGLTFHEVFKMLWSPSEDSGTWRYKRRHTILGFWHQMKVELYDDYLRQFERKGRRHERRR